MHWVRRPTSRRLDSLACLSPEVGTACAASLHRGHRRRRQPARARVPWKGTGSPRRRMTWVLGISAGELRTHEKSLGWLYCVSHTCMLQPELFYVILVGPTSSTTLDISTSPETLLRPPSLNDIEAKSTVSLVHAHTGYLACWVLQAFHTLKTPYVAPSAGYELV